MKMPPEFFDQMRGDMDILIAQVGDVIKEATANGEGRNEALALTLEAIGGATIAPRTLQFLAAYLLVDKIWETSND